MIDWNTAYQKFLLSVITGLTCFAVFYAQQLVQKIELLSVSVESVNKTISIVLHVQNENTNNIQNLKRDAMGMLLRSDFLIWKSENDAEVLRLWNRTREIEEKMK